MRNIMKKILIVTILLQVIFGLGNVSKAALDNQFHEDYYGRETESGTGGGNESSSSNIWDKIFNSANDFLDKGKNQAASGSVTTKQDDDTTTTIKLPTNGDLITITNDIYSIIFPLAVCITVIIGGVLGIKFMIASAEDKAKVKESMVPYVIGCIAIYGAFGIWKICIQIFSVL